MEMNVIDDRFLVSSLMLVDLKHIFLADWHLGLCWIRKK